MKRAIKLSVLAFFLLAQVCVFLSRHYSEKGKQDVLNPEKRLTFLAKAKVFFPWNDRVFYEQARALAEISLNAAAAGTQRTSALRLAVEAGFKSIELNPVSAVYHFQLAQCLHLSSYFHGFSEFPYLEEYKKAASLTGHNSQIYYEVGKFLITRWDTLSSEERDFTIDVLRKALSDKNTEKLRRVIEDWLLYIGSTDKLRPTVPDDPSAWRYYGAMLGQRGVDLELRWQALSRAEYLEFVEARRNFDRGEKDYFYFRSQAAVDSLRQTYEKLEKIHFYQNLRGEKDIDPDEFLSLKKNLALFLSKERLERENKLDEADPFLRQYLEMEKDVQALSNFEKYLKERGHLIEISRYAPSPGDLAKLFFRLNLDFRLNRYRDVARFGEVLSSSLLIIPDNQKQIYARVVSLVGEALLKLDYVYEAEKYLKQALDLNPSDLDNLFRLMKCYSRLNDAAKAAEVRAGIERLLTPDRIFFEGQSLAAGMPFRIDVISDGHQVRYELELERVNQAITPLVSLYLNGRVIWEGFVDRPVLNFEADLEAGQNRIEITPVNSPVKLLSLRSLSRTSLSQ